MSESNQKLGDVSDYRDILKNEFWLRVATEKKFTQAEFAKLLGISPGRLSEVLNGKQGISPSCAYSIANRLKFKPSEKESFVNLVRYKHSKSLIEKELFKKRMDETEKNLVYQPIEIGFFNIISDWYHLAILKTLKLTDFESSTSWIASKLNLNSELVVNAIEKLKRIKLLKCVTGKLILENENNTIPQGIQSNGTRNFHQQVLRNASVAVKSQLPEELELSATFIAIDKDKIPYLKARIENFWKSIDAEMSVSLNKTDVYCLSIQLFSLTPSRKASSSEDEK